MPQSHLPSVTVSHFPFLAKYWDKKIKEYQINASRNKRWKGYKLSEEDVKQMGHLEDLDVDGKVILNLL